MEQTTLTKNPTIEEVAITPDVPATVSDVLPINLQAALARLPENERDEVIALSKTIDVTKIENVMQYGSEPLKRTFEQCGKFLKDERGSEADQAVIKQVIELSKKAKQSNEDFNLVLKDPGFIQKLLLKISSKRRNTRADKIQTCAISNYKLLAELANSYESWLEMLRTAMGNICLSLESDKDNVVMLEKYIIAGELAKERIKNEVEEAKAQYEETGLAEYNQTFRELQEGSNIFEITMANLATARGMYYLSGGQLELIRRSNRNVQKSIHTQKNEQMAILGQMLRNAVLNAKNREVLEGQTSIKALSNELVKEISKAVGLTADQTERLIYSGYINPEAAKEAVTTVIKSCEAIQHVAEDMLPKMRADAAEINKLADQLQESVAALSTPIKANEISENGKSNTPVTTGNSGLHF